MRSPICVLHVAPSLQPNPVKRLLNLQNTSLPEKWLVQRESDKMAARQITQSRRQRHHLQSLRGTSPPAGSHHLFCNIIAPLLTFDSALSPYLDEHFHIFTFSHFHSGPQLFRMHRVDSQRTKTSVICEYINFFANVNKYV